MFRSRNLLPVVSILAAAACADSPNSSLSPIAASAAARSQTGCIATDVVASNEAQLRALLASAQPGDVIAVSGIVSVGGFVPLSEGITLTCANPGDGIATAPGYLDADLLEVLEPNVTIQGLRIIGDGTGYPIYILRSAFEIDGQPVNGINARVIGNDVTCGQGACGFFIGSMNTVIADNVFTASDAGSGIHIQGSGSFRVDGIQVLRNRIVALTPSAASVFGAIRPRDGSDIVVADNEIVGPWSNGIATTMTDDARFERNSVQGATRFGLLVGTSPAGVFQVTGLLARNNTFSGAQNGIHVNGACTNAFVANKVSSPSGTPVFFTATTGANNLMGGDNSVNVDNGNFDCDDDGTVDPNFLTGRKRSGAEPGPTMRDVMPNAGRVQMQ